MSVLEKSSHYNTIFLTTPTISQSTSHSPPLHSPKATALFPPLLSSTIQTLLCSQTMHSSQLLSTNTPQSKQPFRYPRTHRESLHWRLLINLIFLQHIISSPHFPALLPTSYPSTHSPIPAVLLFPPYPPPPVHNDIHR